MKRLFGTDGIRGEAGKYPLDSATVAKLGSALARFFGARNTDSPSFVIGRDTRLSGPEIESALRAGLEAEGAKVVSAGIMTTPGVAFLVASRSFNAGLVISASHNPFEDNGIKVFTDSGRKLDDGSEAEVESLMDSAPDIGTGQIHAAADEDAGEMESGYKRHLISQFPGLSLEGLRIVVDCANGAASHIAPEVLSVLGAEVIAINCSPNGTNINAGCGSMHMEVLRAAVRESGADVGVAFDGDADRALFTDELGNIVDGDGVLWLVAKRLDAGGLLGDRRVIVATVMSNVGLELALKDSGIEMLRADVGDRYVLETLLATGAAVGGEQSGHVIFPRVSLVGDGIVTALNVLNAMTETGRPLSELLSGFEKFPQILVNVKVREKIPFETITAIAEEKRAIETTLEGRGRLLLRYSGTENLARVMIEGPDQSEIEMLANTLAVRISESLS